MATINYLQGMDAYNAMRPADKRLIVVEACTRLAEEITDSIVEPTPDSHSLTYRRYPEGAKVEPTPDSHPTTYLTDPKGALAECISELALDPRVLVRLQEREKSLKENFARRVKRVRDKYNTTQNPGSSDCVYSR